MMDAATSRPDKRLANARARAALLGATLYRCEDDRGADLLVLSKWSLTKQFSGADAFDAVEAWLDQLEGKAGAA